MSSSSSRVFLKKYDVFISFRGEDTRANFTPGLYSALENENVIAYIDYKLERGDDIWPALVKAIKDSVIAIVVFSENYATSRWCLQELVQIMECKKNEQQVVIPVFYKTDPSDVRKQKGSYKKPFEEYDRAAAAAGGYDQNKVDSWRAALTNAANISGWESSTHRDDSQFIENIVKHVLRKLQSVQYEYEQGLVGIEEQCEAIEGLSGKLGRRIGVWGMGGTGKTTIAKALFAKHSAKYDSVCFLKDLREESQIHGLPHIRDELLSELLRELQVTTASNFSGISSDLSTRRVLIVLDDVDSSEQLESLFVGLGELGEGSSLIVTTRDRHLLHGIVDVIHEIKPWDFDKSLVLFSLAAFKKSQPDEPYKDLSQRAVEYARGLPFALKILGSYFRSKKLQFCESELSKLESKEKSCKEIQDLFIVSYHGLSRQEQAVFLDIAFFFKDRDEDSVISILDACGFGAARGIKSLKDKALITISKRNTIQMLDFLQDLAFDIVQNDATDPRRGSLLRESGVSSLDLDCRSKGTPSEVVEGAVIDLSQESCKYEFSASIFNVPKLRIFKFYVPPGKKLSTSISFSYYGHSDRGCAELKYFEWTKYPERSLPRNFCVKFLVEIRMPYSHVEELWEGTQELVNLETLDLSECRYLKRIPDLSKASKLKQVYLSGCKKMQELHPSLLSLDTLVTLTLDRCLGLTSLKSEKHLRCLEMLNVNDCDNLEEFSVSSDSMKRLDLSKTRVKRLCPSIGRLSKLVWLNIVGSRLQNLPNELSCLTSLEELRISNCGAVDKEKLHVLFTGLRSLKLLHLKDCQKLFELPDNISALSSLQELRLDSSYVEMFPTSIKLLEKLKILSLKYCSKLQSLPELPLFIEELIANSISLVTRSTLKTFAYKMKGKEKHISFMNARELDNDSILWISEDVMFAMRRAELHNELVRRSGVETDSYNYNSVTVCFPGSCVPSGSDSGKGSSAYRSTGSSVTIEPHDRSLSHWLGTIYSVALSPPPGTTLGVGKIGCQIYGKKGVSEQRECKTTWYGKDVELTFSDHVFLWHSSSFDDAEVFEFFFITYDGKKNYGGVKIKECGVDLMYCSNSELDNFIKEAEMEEIEPEIKSELGVLELQSSLDLREDHINLWQPEDDAAEEREWLTRVDMPPDFLPYSSY